eukprot:TRINITY_DN55571_c0_g1_i1.p1 TRINITY_DN55571_c0_g1~~TRINITY_DN55571_c0_g1_i1.p1  ORF type:complete len:239 (+),score=42.80 TRINITY_DN55571_c0_g1_i1:77-793(+)
MQRLALFSRHVVSTASRSGGHAAASASRALAASTTQGVSLTGHYSQLTGVYAEKAQRAFRGEVAVRSDDGWAVATFAGGCFWGPQVFFDRVQGVMATSVGYSQGHTEKPSYESVCAGGTGHTEAVQVFFDDSVISYEKLLETFLGYIDPTVVDGQRGDFGKQYRTGIYFHTEEQKVLAEAALALEQVKRGQPIATEIREAEVYWPAEAYHQDYLVKGGKYGEAQSNAKGNTEKIRCYG